MSEHGPETHCYWHERYVELEETLAYSFQGFATTMEAQAAADPAANVGLQRELDEARRQLAKLRNSKLGRLQAAYWKLLPRVKRKVASLRPSR